MYKQKNITKLTSLILSMVLLISCDFSNTKEVKIENKYSVTLPSYLKVTTNMNNAASLQYKDSIGELYIIVIEESQKDFKKALIDNNLIEKYPFNLDNYSNIVFENMKNSLKDVKMSKVQNANINNANSKLTEISGKLKGLDFYYNVAIIMGKDKFYQVITWTFQKKKNKYKEVMQKMINSFKEL